MPEFSLFFSLAPGTVIGVYVIWYPGCVKRPSLTPDIYMLEAAMSALNGRGERPVFFQPQGLPSPKHF